MAPPEDHRVLLPVGNHLGLASQRALQEGRQTHPAELAGLWQALGERAGQQQKQPELDPAGIASWRWDTAMDRLGVTA